jgi:hypothetical protein
MDFSVDIRILASPRASVFGFTARLQSFSAPNTYRGSSTLGQSCRIDSIGVRSGSCVPETRPYPCSSIQNDLARVQLLPGSSKGQRSTKGRLCRHPANVSAVGGRVGHQSSEAASDLCPRSHLEIGSHDSGPPCGFHTGLGPVLDRSTRRLAAVSVSSSNPSGRGSPLIRGPLCRDGPQAATKSPWQMIRYAVALWPIAAQQSSPIPKPSVGLRFSEGPAFP